MTLQLRDATVEVGGHALSLRWAASMDRLMGEGVPYGAAPWPASVALADALVGAPALVLGRSVLELGCGIGWCSVLAGMLGARSVLATDNESLVAPLVAENARRNGARVAFAQYAWRHGAPPARAETVIASDVLYDPAAEAALLDAADACLEDGGVFLLADPGRLALEHLMRRARGRGWNVDERTVRVERTSHPGCAAILAAHPAPAGPCHVVTLRR